MRQKFHIFSLSMNEKKRTESRASMTGMMIFGLFLSLLCPRPAKAGILDKLKDFNPDIFITDTLDLSASDTLACNFRSRITVLDRRPLSGNILDIHQINRYKYIPVDELILVHPAVDTLIRCSLPDDSTLTGTLSLGHLRIWYDGKPWFDKGYKLNAYTIYRSANGDTARDWLWEIPVHFRKKEAKASAFRRAVDQFTDNQGKALESLTVIPLYPFPYRRQLQSWAEYGFFGDGYSLNAHFTLDYPTDDMHNYRRGSPGVFYRKSRRAESISIGGRHQSWNTRLSDAWTFRTETGLRIGFNNFNRHYFNHLDPWDIMSVMATWQNSLIRDPARKRGLTAGIGIIQIVRALPTVLPVWEAGVTFNIGIKLP